MRRAFYSDFHHPIPKLNEALNTVTGCKVGSREWPVTSSAWPPGLAPSWLWDSPGHSETCGHPPQASGILQCDS